MNRTLLSVVTAACVLALAEGRAAAGSLTFTYDWSLSDSIVSTPLQNGGQSSVLLTSTNGPLVGPGNFTNQSAATVTANSGFLDATPDSFPKAGAPFTMTVKIHDDTTNLSKQLSFKGQLFGTLSLNTANLTGSFGVNGDATTKQLTFDVGNGMSDVYNVSIGPFQPLVYGGQVQGLLSTGATNSSSVNFSVDAEQVGNSTGGGPKQTPEPGALVLALLGVGGVFAARRVRRPLPV